jgi:hypothetical protein
MPNSGSPWWHWSATACSTRSACAARWSCRAWQSLPCNAGAAAAAEATTAAATATGGTPNTTWIAHRRPRRRAAARSSARSARSARSAVVEPQWTRHMELWAKRSRPHRRPAAAAARTAASRHFSRATGCESRATGPRDRQHSNRRSSCTAGPRHPARRRITPRPQPQLRTHLVLLRQPPVGERLFHRLFPQQHSRQRRWPQQQLPTRAGGPRPVAPVPRSPANSRLEGRCGRLPPPRPWLISGLRRSRLQQAPAIRRQVWAWAWVRASALPRAWTMT